MQKVLNISASLLLSLWYILATAGIDIHSDRHDCRTYVISLLKGTSCERIHPEDDCVCRHSHHSSKEEEICDYDCTDDVHILSLTGEEQPDLHLIQVSQNQAVTSYIQPDVLSLCRFFSDREIIHSPPENLLKRLCILRV